MAEPTSNSPQRAPAIVRNETQRPAAKRERQANLGGPRLKLSVFGSVPGHHLYWANDEEGAIEQLLHEGFEFVTPAEVQMQSHTVVADTDVANRVSRYVGKTENGSPLRAFLLKCTDETWADRESDRYAQADNWDEAIRAGRVQHDTGRYTPKGVKIALDTEFVKSY